MTKFFFLLLLLIIAVEYIQSKNVQRTYIVVRDRKIRDNRLSNYTIYDSLGKKELYRIKTISTDIDTMMLVNYPAKNMIGNLEGEWADEIFNVSFSIYSLKSYKWIDGTMKKVKKTFINKYSIEWDSKIVIMKDTFISRTMKFYDEKQNELFAEFKATSKWFGNFKYTLTIYSDYIPDAIYFFALAISDHRYQIQLLNSD